jgi:two-component sensor histidine kinase
MEPNYRERPPPADALAFPIGQPFMDFDDGRALAQAIVDTIREPLLVLDKDLRVVAASRSFCLTFKVAKENVQGRLVYALGDGEWNIPELRLLLEKILPRHTVMEAYEVEHDFFGIGRRKMLLNAREVFNQRNAHKLILLAIEDVTERRAAERETSDLLQQKEILLQEMQHRVANSLQIIASILMLKARAVQSEEIRLHLRDAHDRVMCVATVQQQLQASGHGDPIELGPYLSRLCDALAASMIGDSRPITLKVEADAGTAISGEAVSIGLIITELVINALKHAFPGGSEGEILVGYDVDGADWRLSVSDNGVGLQRHGSGHRPTGLGTSIVEALAHQLKARVEIAGRSPGMIVSIVHAT